MTHTLPRNDMVIADNSEHLLCEGGYAKINEGTLIWLDKQKCWKRQEEDLGNHPSMYMVISMEMKKLNMFQTKKESICVEV